MNWKDLFKGYPKEWTKYAMMGMSATLRGMILISNFVDKDRLVEIMSNTLKRVEKDLKEIKKGE